MTNPGWGMKPRPAPYFGFRVFWTILLVAALLGAISLAARASDCSSMMRLAQEHSNDMARRGSLDHRGFSDRGRRGARAENVALASSKAQAMRLWHASPPHAARR